jgi:uncharacterized repeat protein (TIGR02543 family)
MKKILAFLFAVSLFYFVGAQSVLASSNVNVESVSYFGPSNSTSGNATVGRGSPVTFNHSGVSSEYSFAFYAVNDIIRDDFPIGQQFVARKDMKLTAVFYPNGTVTPANARHVVVFADASSKIIDIQYVVDGGDASEPNPSLLPPMPAFAKEAETKWLTSTNVSDLTEITSNRVYFLQYELDTTTQFNVIVNSGSGDGSYLYNTVVTATPDAPVGENVFSHWEDAEGNVLSYKESYKFTVLSNVSITAIYSASPVSAMPVVNMSDALALRDDYVSYKGQFDIPSGLTLVEYGFIFSRSSEVLELDSLGATIVPSNVHNGQTGEFLRSFPDNTFNSIRAYLILKNVSEQEIVVYSGNYYRNENMLSPELIETVNFEVSSGFTNGTVYNSLTVKNDGPTGKQWGSVYGTVSGTDPIADSSSAQMRWYSANPSNLGYFVMNYTITDLAYITFLSSSTGGNNVKVEYAVNGGSFTGAEIFTLTTTPTNYQFNINQTGDVKVRFTLVSGGVNGTRLYIDDVSFYRLGQPSPSQKVHEVIYNDDGLTTEYIQNNGLISVPSKSKTGYTFNGWFTDVALTQSFNASSPVVQSLQLYAKWTINEYTITFNSAGGSAVSSISQNYNTAIVAPADPTREGYSFSGWSPAVPSNMPANNLELTAQWSINQYTITFDSNEGSAVSSITQNFGTSVSAPVNPTREGYLFQGWFTDDNTFLNAYTFSTMPAESITVYAKWEEQVGTYFTVTFNSNGGSAVSSEEVLEDGFATEPTPPTKSGYSFVNWQDESNVVWDFENDPITEAMTLYATWSAISYSISFDNLQGTTQSNPSSYTIETSTITLSNPSARTGYTFTGWFTALEGGSQVTQIALGSTGNVTLYARWISNTVTASYTGTTSVNMTSDSSANAGLINLSSSRFSVVSTQRVISPLHVGLNSAGQIRLYGSSDGNGNILTINVLGAYKITDIEFTFGSTVGSAIITTGVTQQFSGALTANSKLTYTGLDVTGFSIKNTNTSTGQIYILSIKITYIPE